MAETGWLIELSERVHRVPHYWGITSEDGLDWTVAHELAIRFARKQDAQAIIDYYGWTEATAVEHQWG